MTQRPGHRPGSEHSQELLDLWDKLNPEARKMVPFTAPAVAKEERVLLEGVGLPVLGDETGANAFAQSAVVGEQPR